MQFKFQAAHVFYSSDVTLPIEKWSEEHCFSSNANQVDKCLKSVASSLLISLENIMKWPKVDTWCMFKGMY